MCAVRDHAYFVNGHFVDFLLIIKISVSEE